jgi:PAS domain S-box-containing protein
MTEQNAAPPPLTQREPASPLGQRSTGAWLRIRRRYALLWRGSVAAVYLCGAICVLLGLVGLLGPQVGVDVLRSLSADAGPLKPNSAATLAQAGLALLLFAAGRRRNSPVLPRIGQGVAVLVTGAGLLAAAQHLFGWDPGIHQMLQHDAVAVGASRMAPFSALGFSVAGLALCGLALPGWRSLTNVFAAVVALVGLLGVLGYVWDARALAMDEWARPVAIPMAIGFLVLSVGILVASIRFGRPRTTLRFLLDPIEFRVVATFVGALLALTVLGGLTYKSAVRNSLHAAGLREVRLLRGTLSGLQGQVSAAAFAQRNYLITGDRSAVAEWRQAAAQVQATRNRLSASVPRLDPSERAQFVAVDRALSGFLQALRADADVYARQGRPAAAAAIQSGASSAAMKQVRDALQRMDDLERDDEQRRQFAMKARQREVLVITVLALITATIVLAPVFLTIRRQMAARYATGRALRRHSSQATASNRFLESLIQNIPHMIFVKDARDLRFVRLNRAAEEFTGLRECDIVGKSDHDLFPRHEADGFTAIDREVLRRGEVVDIPEEEVHRPDGSVRILYTRKIPLLDGNARPTHILGIAEDVTAAREKEKQIHRLNQALRARAAEVESINRAKSAFLATMSHEIRTPMNGMLGMVELLALSPLDDSQRETLGVVSESGRSLLRIIDDILDFSKIEAGKLELHEQVESLPSILQEIRQIHAAVAASKGLVVTGWSDPALSPAVWVDPVRLRQILNNFASNAVKFTARGRVDIRAERVGDGHGVQTVRFSVTDTGTGIAPEEQRLLFEPFSQVGEACRGAAGGTGLGLAISRRLAELMSGLVSMRSEPGRGTTISLLVPLRTAPAELLPKERGERLAQLREATRRLRPAPPVAAAEAEGTLVLVVDDHPVNRTLLQRQLAAIGYASQSAHAGHEALRMWQSGRFGLVLTDCQMAGMNGYQLAAEIRRREAAAGAARTPIVACTAMALAGEKEHCLQAGMDDVLFKPVALGQMLQTLGTWLPIPVSAGAHEQATGAAGLRVTWGADEETRTSILASYLDSLPEDASALREAVGRWDVEGILQAAHRLLGAGAMVGAQGIVESCELVRHSAQERSRNGVAAAMAAFEAEYARLLPAGDEAAPASGRRELVRGT